jgi:hypothetical protein
LSRDQLEGRIPAKGGVARAKHFTHATRAQPTDQIVMSEPLTNDEVSFAILVYGEARG